MSAAEPVIRTLSHELRQPLSAIESIAYYLQLALPGCDPKIADQLARLRALVDQSNWILSDALLLAQQGSVHPEALDLDEMVSEFVMDESFCEGPHPSFDLNLASIPVWMDYQQARQMVKNVCRLFRLAARPNSVIQIQTRVLPNGSVLLKAQAAGPVIEQDDMPAGTSLSLACLQKIAEENSASLFMNFADPLRLELGIEIPTARQNASALHAVASVPFAFVEDARRAPTAPDSL
jgi:signal transduction histidine kinase